MAVIIRKKVIHNHIGSPSEQGICFPNLFPASDKHNAYYMCACNSAACGEIYIEDTKGTYKAKLSTESNDCGLTNLKYKWYFSGELISETDSINPETDGEYSLTVTGTDAKTGESKQVDFNINLYEADRWSNFIMGTQSIFGMALGDTLIDGAAFGSVIVR